VSSLSIHSFLFHSPFCFVLQNSLASLHSLVTFFKPLFLLFCVAVAVAVTVAVAALADGTAAAVACAVTVTVAVAVIAVIVDWHL